MIYNNENAPFPKEDGEARPHLDCDKANRSTHIGDILQREALSATLDGFPADALPAPLRQLMTDMVEINQFEPSFVALSLLSAAASAIGNRAHLEISPTWQTAPILYCMLVGRPGAGKTPPMEAFYQPMRRIDRQLFADYVCQMGQYVANKEKSSAAPEAKRLIVSDITPETVKRQLMANPDGLSMIYDEITGLFASGGRYNGSADGFITDLLSMWSGVPVSVNRVSSEAVYVDQPCLNIIGTTQTVKIQELLGKGYGDNGLLDRFIFAYPGSGQVPPVRPYDAEADRRVRQSLAMWSDTVDKLRALSDGRRGPALMRFTPWGLAEFADFRNAMRAKINAEADDRYVRSRDSKRDLQVARLALVLQCLHNVCADQPTALAVDGRVVKDAVAVSDYFEQCYDRIVAKSATTNLTPSLVDFLSVLPQRFTTREAKDLAERSNTDPRYVQRYLNRLVKDGLLRHSERGIYSLVRS